MKKTHLEAKPGHSHGSAGAPGDDCSGERLHDHSREHDHHSGHSDHGHGHGGHSHFGHHHHLGGGGGDGDHAPRALSRALWITLAFMFVEFAGGYYANSLALISDGAHMLTDVGALMLSFFIYQVTQKPVTPQMSFGYHRAEILGALGSGLVIWFLAGILIFEGIARFGSPPDVQGPIVFWIALIGLLMNLLSMWMLHGAQKHNLNIRAAYLHMLTDCLGSVGAIIAGGVLWFTGWRLIDPIITVITSALMIWSSWALVKESVQVLMESTPGHIDSQKILRDLSAIAGVSEVHDLHVWTVSSGRLALSVHLISPDSERVLAEAHDVLAARYGIVHTTIQVEHPDRFSSDRCYDCR